MFPSVCSRRCLVHQGKAPLCAVRPPHSLQATTSHQAIFLLIILIGSFWISDDTMAGFATLCLYGSTLFIAIQVPDQPRLRSLRVDSSTPRVYRSCACSIGCIYSTRHGETQPMKMPATSTDCSGRRLHASPWPSFSSSSPSCSSELEARSAPSLHTHRVTTVSRTASGARGRVLPSSATGCSFAIAQTSVTLVSCVAFSLLSISGIVGHSSLML